jgi:hypothetical protein
MSAAVYQEPEPEDDRTIQEITQTDYSRPWSPRMMELIAKAKADLADMKKSGGEVLRTASTCVPFLSLSLLLCFSLPLHSGVFVLRVKDGGNLCVCVCVCVCACVRVRVRVRVRVCVRAPVYIYMCVSVWTLSILSHSALMTPSFPSR